VAAPSRFFSYDDAKGLLPAVREKTEAALRDAEARQADQRAVEEVVAGWVRSLADMGVHAKGLWLVDFDNGSGFYCWSYPERSLEYFHSYEDGFDGRMRIQ
jgi:hypothetical protein